MVQFKDCFLGTRQARLRARRLQPALRARRRQAQRPRERGLHRPPSHLLRDAGQLLLRRLLQEGRDPLRLGLRHRHARRSTRRASWSRCTQTDDEAFDLWHKKSACPRTRSCASATSRAAAPTTSGRWAKPAPAARAPRSSSITARTFRAARRVRPMPTAIAGSRSGTWCSCSSTARPTASSRRCRSPPWTRARASSACPR